MRRLLARQNVRRGAAKRFMEMETVWNSNAKEQAKVSIDQVAATSLMRAIQPQIVAGADHTEIGTANTSEHGGRAFRIPAGAFATSVQFTTRFRPRILPHRAPRRLA